MAKPTDSQAIDSSPYGSSAGLAGDPRSPVGGGGPGKFVTPSSLGSGGNDSNPIPHPQSPAMRHDTIDGADVKDLRNRGLELDTPSPLDAGTPQKAPPTTTAKQTPIKRPGVKEDYDFVVDVLADGTDAEDSRKFSARAVLDARGLVLVAPTWDLDPATNKVIKVIGKYKITGKVTIQVRYGTKAKPTDTPAWGRGTTSADQTAGNTTIGFHESCHVADFIANIKAGTLPSFKGGVGKSNDDMEKAATDFDTAVNDYFKNLETISRNNTDEVGTKFTDYAATHVTASSDVG